MGVVHNDFKREMLFYRQAQAAVLEAIPRLHSMNIRTKRPEDYFAQMAKTDDHMNKIYGIRSNNGSSPSHWARGNGGVARKALQALEGLKLAEKDPNGGRRLTSQGRRDLDRIAAQLKAKKAEALAAQAAAVISTA